MIRTKSAASLAKLYRASWRKKSRLMVRNERPATVAQITAARSAEWRSADSLILISPQNYQGHDNPPKNRPMQSQVAGYVSSNACRSCHSGNYATWHASYHRTMTQVAMPDSLPQNMDQLQLALNGSEYKVERRGDAFFVHKRREGASYGDGQQIVLVTGSHTLQIPWLETSQGPTP